MQQAADGEHIARRAAGSRLRVVALSGCLLLYLACVIGRLEAQLLEPAWLPSPSQWASFPIPYAWTLPVQIVVLMLMALSVYDHVRGDGIFRPRRPMTRRLLMGSAVVYAGIVAVRFALAYSSPPYDALDSGLLAALSHWILAAFLVFASVPPERSGAIRRRSRAAARRRAIMTEADFVADEQLFELGYLDPSIASPRAEGTVRAEEDPMTRLRRLLNA